MFISEPLESLVDRMRPSKCTTHLAIVQEFLLKNCMLTKQSTQIWFKCHSCHTTCGHHKYSPLEKPSELWTSISVTLSMDLRAHQPWNGSILNAARFCIQNEPWRGQVLTDIIAIWKNHFHDFETLVLPRPGWGAACDPPLGHPAAPQDWASLSLRNLESPRQEGDTSAPGTSGIFRSSRPLCSV